MWKMGAGNGSFFRSFITKAAAVSAVVATVPLASFGRGTGNRENTLSQVSSDRREKVWNTVRFPSKVGIGGVAIGNGFHINTNEQITHTLQTAWDAGVRYYDTSPFYGFGLSERRMGHFLFEKKRENFLISTKIGRIFEPDTHYDES